MTAPQDDKFYIIQRVKALTAQLQEILNVSMTKSTFSIILNVFNLLFKTFLSPV